MDDLISRQAAIDELGEKPLAWTDSEYELALQQQWEADVDAIKAVPSAQPLTAYVISDEDGNIKCSNCGSFECWGNYCMNCGAKMRGKNNG